MRIAAPVRDRVMRELAHESSAERHTACEQASILQSLDNLLTYPWLKRKVEQGKLMLHGWYFDIGSGSLMAYSPRQQQFLPMVCPIARPRDHGPGFVVV
jgi:carbonic anhydrase